MSSSASHGGVGGGAASLAGKQSVSSGMSKSKSETVNYLLLYEAMVRHQDLEFDATHDHIALTAGRIRHLGRRGGANNRNASSSGSATVPALVDEDGAPEGMITYLQMRRCLLRLGYTWNRSLLHTDPASASASAAASSVGGGTSASQQPQYYYSYDDDVSVMSSTSASSFVSGGGISATSTQGSLGGVRDIIATDAQLIMLLTTLVEMEERHRAARLAAKEEVEEEDSDEDEEEKEEEEEDVSSLGLYLPEFIQAYKLIIGGMQSLQTFPDETDAKACEALGIRPGDGAALQELRVRSRERTLGLLRLFGPDSKLYADNGASSLQRQSAGEDPTSNKERGGKKKKKTRDGLRQTSNRTKGRSSSKGRGNLKAKDGLLPRLNEEEIRTLVHSKDAALARIMEDHESEMNVMANNMEELRLKGIQTQKLMRRRRKRTRIALALGFLLLAIGGGFYEFKKREQVKVEIATGREAERRADAATIKSLKEEVASLRTKLDDAEATIRYEEGRYVDANERLEKASRTLEESEKRWRSEQRELETCRVTRKELDEQLSSARARNDEGEEEVAWCRERLEGAERAMEGMERALKKSRSEEKSEVPSFAEIAKEMEKDKELAAAGGEESGDGQRGGESDKKKVKSRPVQMEMKYNKSFRNAVILRQVYSAVAGMVVSMLLPAAKLAKVFSLFLK